MLRMSKLSELYAFMLRTIQCARKLWRSGILILGMFLLMTCVSCVHRHPFDGGGAIMLGSLQHGMSEFAVKRPKGTHHCRLIVVCPKADANELLLALKGRVVVIQDDQIVTEFSIGPETVKQCLWFKDNQRVVGYFLHGEATLDNSIYAEDNYTIEIELANQPPTDSRVYFFYLAWYYGYF